MSYCLNLLGSLDLRDGQGNPVSSVLQQPRRLALLIYLALSERDTMVKRDTLLGVFWPDMPQENGRRALSQAIHFLRRSLGADAILTRGVEDVGLNSAIVECDATSFLTALKALDARAACAAYGGDLLPGFYISGVQEFEEWLSLTRDSLRRKAAEAFWTVAEEAKVQGQHVSAAASARRAAELASDNESATRRLMEFLDSIADRAGALDAYETLVRKLQTEFECAPSAKTRELADRIRSTRDAAVTLNSDVVISDSPPSPLSKLPWREITSHSRTLAGTAVLMVAFLSLWGLSRKMGARAEPLRVDASVLVDQPKVFDAGIRDVASSVVSDVSAALVEVPRLRVASGSAATNATSANVHFVLQPNFSVRDGQLYVVASLIDEGTHTIVKSASFTAKANDESSLDALSKDMSEFARMAMGRHIRLTELQQLKSQDADVLIQSGMVRLRADSLRSKGLASYALLTLERADSLVADALRQHKSADLLEERAALATARMWVYKVPPLLDPNGVNRALADGIKYADAAIDVDPSSASAFETRGLLTYQQWFFGSQTSSASLRDQAESFLLKAVALNPHAADAWSSLSSIYGAKGDFVHAYYAATKALENDTYMEVAYAATWQAFTAALENGDSAAASSWCDDIGRRSEGDWSSAYCKLQIIAWSDKPSDAALARANALVKNVAEQRTNEPFMSAVNGVLAVIHAKRGERSTTLELLKSVDSGPLASENQLIKAWALSALDMKKQARSVLSAYISGSPSTRAGYAQSRRFSRSS